MAREALISGTGDEQTWHKLLGDAYLKLGMLLQQMDLYVQTIKTF